MKPPCKTCKNKGCGSYHDICAPYQAYVEECHNDNDKAKEFKDRYFLNKFDSINRAKKVKSKVIGTMNKKKGVRSNG